MAVYRLDQVQGLLLGLIDKAHSGEEVLIICDGEVVAELAPRNELSSEERQSMRAEAAEEAARYADASALGPAGPDREGP